MTKGETDGARTAPITIACGAETLAQSTTKQQVLETTPSPRIPLIAVVSQLRSQRTAGEFDLMHTKPTWQTKKRVLAGQQAFRESSN